MKLLTATIVTAVLLLAAAPAQRENRAEVALRAAMDKEMVDGDLKAAIEMYKRIVTNPGGNRAVAAKALLQMGQCYEKLGQAEARNAYEQLVKQYADQTEQAQAARARLAALAGTGARATGTEMVIRRVRSGSDVDFSGEPSPDGKYISIRDRVNQPAIWEIATGQTRRFASKDNWSGVEQAFSSRWSPDGKKIVFCLLTKDISFETWIAGMDGSEPRRLRQAAPLDWSPDGRSILALVSPGERFGEDSPQMALVSVADGSLNILSTAANPFFSWSAVFSPDGKYIVYDYPQQEKAQARDIFLLSIDGKQVTPLVRHPGHDQLLGWVPGTDIILFASNRAGTQDAWALHVADGKPQGEPILVRKGLGQISPMGFTDSGSFYYGLSVSIADVYEGALDLTKGTVVEPPKKIFQRVVGSSQSPEWSPDGKCLAYVSERKEGSAPQSSYILCIRSAQDGAEREIPLAVQSFWNLHWSADSRAVFATVTDKECQGLFKFDIETGEPALIAQSSSGSLIKSFAVSPDGISVFYAPFQWTKKLSTIVRRDLKTGEEKEIYRQAAPPDLGGLAISPDGKYLSFCTLNISPNQSYDMVAKLGYVIRIVPSGGGETRELLPGKIEEWVSPVWVQNGKAILFGGKITGPKETRRELWRVPVDGGDPQRVNSDMAPRDIRLHPDGRRIVFTSGNTLNEVWVMENFLPAIKAVK